VIKFGIALILLTLAVFGCVAALYVIKQGVHDWIKRDDR